MDLRLQITCYSRGIVPLAKQAGQGETQWQPQPQTQPRHRDQQEIKPAWFAVPGSGQTLKQIQKQQTSGHKNQVRIKNDKVSGGVQEKGGETNQQGQQSNWLGKNPARQLPEKRQANDDTGQDGGGAEIINKIMEASQGQIRDRGKPGTRVLQAGPLVGHA
jgi:hypothetical protein